TYSLKFAQPRNVTFQIKPTTTIKNDKIHLLIDSLSDSYKEIADMFTQFKIDEEGIHLPRQNKMFFETVMTNKSFNQYVTIHQHQEEEFKQSVNFTWYKAPVVKVDEDYIDDDFDNMLASE